MVLIWGKNKATNEIDSTTEKNQNEHEILLKLFEEKVEEINKLDGLRVKVKGLHFSETDSYIFTLNEKCYTLTHKIDKYVRKYSDDDMRAILEEKSSEFDFEEYHCELFDTTKISQSSEYVGELEYTNIGINFKIINNNNPKDFIEIMMNQFGQNLTSYQSFFQKIGVKNFYNVIDIPDESFSVVVLQKNDFLSDQSYQFFREKNTIYFVRRHPKSYNAKACIAQLNINDIMYYKSVGELRYEQQISGGGGMGINYGSAVIGGVLFGSAGAIIGSCTNSFFKYRISTFRI